MRVTSARGRVGFTPRRRASSRSLAATGRIPRDPDEEFIAGLGRTRRRVPYEWDDNLSLVEWRLVEARDYARGVEVGRALARVLVALGESPSPARDPWSAKRTQLPRPPGTRTTH